MVLFSRLGLIASIALLGAAMTVPADAGRFGGGKGASRSGIGGAGIRVHRGGRGSFRHRRRGRLNGFGKRRVLGLSNGRRCPTLRSYYVRTYRGSPCRYYPLAYESDAFLIDDYEPQPLWIYRQPGLARPWSWRNFRKKAGWEQKYRLWQTRIYTNPIYGPSWAW